MVEKHASCNLSTKLLYRSSRSQMFFKIGVSYEFHNIHRKTHVLQSRWIKVADLTDCNFIKKRLQHKCFPANIAKFPRKTFFTEHLRWLLLYFRHYSTRRHRRNGKKHSRNKFSYNYVGSPTQADHNSWRSQYSDEKAIVTCKV